MVLLDTQVPSLCDNSLSHAFIICKLPVRMLHFTRSLPKHHLLITVAFILLGVSYLSKRRYFLLRIFFALPSQCRLILNTYIDSFQPLICRQQHSEGSQVTEWPGVGFVLAVETHRENTNGSVARAE